MNVGIQKNSGHCYESEILAKGLVERLTENSIPAHISVSEKKAVTTGTEKGVSHNKTEISEMYCVSWGEEHDTKVWSLDPTLGAK